MKSQGMAFADLDTNDLKDIQCWKEQTDKEKPTFNNKTPSYIKFIRADTFMVGFGCQSQMEVFAQNKDRHCFIDATGNVTRSQADSSRQFFYSVIFRSELIGKTIPLFEVISDRHDIA